MSNELRQQRSQLRLSQTRLARLSGVSRFKICLHELGDRSLSTGELVLIENALLREAGRLRGVAEKLERRVTATA